AGKFDNVWRELSPILDEELQLLPRKFREPIVLCYLQGKTYDEAARELGWPKSSMGRWIVRARELLRHRLERRGITMSSAVLFATIAEQSAETAVPDALSALAIRAAMAIASGSSALTSIVSENAVGLAEMDGDRGLQVSRCSAGPARGRRCG